eukprot:Plantae.Rhodophyta-Purpureofilum_apyrenoidigerum.ctg41628.p1 GENE.Plantae.Rhodophyta-Purpureofilum_apyrenoidigerum.ctg41628~~Plantae.Rhodophyta-Purpureofilum_apyrenoidigerum.ctg41628.p1  ORF type:complete len:167 (-),score=38.76 Plantae.Rhodophyta-Purpureofilum_apyrenoidigerum.ctg41628:339-839(-)
MGEGRGFGERMLRQMGWESGAGLGVRGDGVREAVKVPKKGDRLGVGGVKENKWGDNWWERAFEEAVSRGKKKDVEEKQDGSPMAMESLLEACGGRRCRVAGKGKLARVTAQEKKATAKAHKAKSEIKESMGPPEKSLKKSRKAHKSAKGDPDFPKQDKRKPAKVCA